MIAGEFRSRLLQSVAGSEVRPTPDRLRETLFNILAPEIAGTVFLDVYAGSGAVGIEALSRGAARSVFIENSKAAIAVLERNLKSLGLEKRSLVLKGTARKKLEPGLADLVFLDPPYPLESEYAVSLGLLGGDERARIVVAQHSVRTKLEDEYGGMRKYRELRQGENALTFYAAASGGDKLG